ncbi:hypothetical protein [uncultured Phascolarctobacterium sp.]|uniref:hypothetical protein n=1 Tax=uncultured Phascolarctobacterium sp. TaxID=512296 RepID=UPI0027D971B3|nr:hypothetical protein [uncultured Phascolarctobacterium sp.]
MAHLKVYLKGTPGAADGEEWTDDTTIKGIMTNTQASSKGHGCAFLPICLRCEEGFKASNVKLVGVNKTYYVMFYSGYNDSDQYFRTLERFKKVMASCSKNVNSLYSSATGIDVGTTNVLIVLAVMGNIDDSTSLTDLISISYIEDAVA